MRLGPAVRVGAEDGRLVERLGDALREGLLYERLGDALRVELLDGRDDVLRPKELDELDGREADDPREP